MQKTITIALVSVHMTSQALCQGDDPPDGPYSSSVMGAGIQGAMQEAEQDEEPLAGDYGH